MKLIKRFFSFFLPLFLLCGCASPAEPGEIAATTLPVWELTARLCEGTGLGVTRLVTEEVSCLHDYSLNVRQVKAAEAAQVLVISGAGLEAFLEDLLLSADILDASQGIALLEPVTPHSHDSEDAGHHDGHDHDHDPHIWLSPANAKTMAQNICQGLSSRFPRHREVFQENLSSIIKDLDALDSYGRQRLSRLACRDLVTFHDGFSYFAQAFDLEILEAVEEESGSEASAAELIHLIREVEHHALPAVFTEKSGSVSAAGIIARETGCAVFSLDMAMAGDSYLEAMYHNIDTIKEALG